ncbi:MAG: DUF4386 domain-containing protein [Thermoanaerobaculaceae bacterium]|jgi:hypothetical protein
MTSTKRTARFAGLLYLLVGITGFFSLMVVPGKLIVRGNATATASNILSHESLFRLGVVSNLVASTVFIFLALVLYRLLKGVNQHHASLMTILVFVQVPLAFLNELNHLAALLLVRGADFLSVFDKPQRDALAMLFLNLEGQGTIVSQIFWGLWLLPFGVLVFRSGLLPRVLGVWLIVNGFAYLTMSFSGLLVPQYYDMVFRIASPALLGEMAIMLWLLIMGAKPQPLDAAASSSAAV